MSSARARAAEAVRSALGGHDPTPEQRAAIEAPLRHGVIDAGAGSGKTAVMTARVVHLIASGAAQPTEILGLTFTNRATEELQHRVRIAMSTLGLALGEHPTIQTYNGFAAQLIEDHAIRGGLEPGARLLTAGQSYQLLWEVIGGMTFEANEVRSPYLVGQASDLIAAMANHEVTPQALVDHERATIAKMRIRSLNRNEERYLLAMEKRIELAEVARRFDEIKRIRGVLDFADQITLAVRLAQDPLVQKAFRSRYRVLLLDEYQDTNTAQARLIASLALGEDGPVVTAVGDPAQNIYAWRGASLRNIVHFHEEFRDDEGEAARFDLRTNFRSASSIIEVANAVLASTASNPEARALRPRKDAPLGAVHAAVLPDQIGEARWIADQVAAEVEGGTPPEEIAILGRKRRVIAPIHQALLDRGIAVEVIELGGLLETPEVVDVLAYLRAIQDPGDNIAFARILSGPRWRIGYRDLAMLARATLASNRALRDEGRGDEQVPYEIGVSLEGLEEVAGLSDEGRDRLTSFRDLYRDLRRSPLGPVDLLEEVIERSGLRLEIAVAESARARSARRNLANLVEQAAGFRSVDGVTTLGSFLSWLDAIDDSPESLSLAQPSEEASVKILTIHSAKGLEFDVVFLAGLVGGRDSKIFPDTTRQPNPVRNAAYLPFELRGDADEMPRYEGNLAAFEREIRLRAMREERRLLYVAATRARRRLVGTAAYWYLPAESNESLKRPLGPSEFLSLIADHPASTILVDDPPPEVNPLIGYRAQAALHWPPPARPGPPEGFPRSVAQAVKDARAEANEEGRLVAPDPAHHVEPRVPATLSVTALVTHATCPQKFHWTVVRPLPRRPSSAARIGTIVHDWIAERHEPQLRLLDPEEFAPRPVPGRIATLRERFATTRFAALEPAFVEHPFAIAVDGRIIQGRIDAIFVHEGQVTEIVDWKTGSAPIEEGAERWQMELYALALQRIMGIDPAHLRTTFVYLGDDPIVERSVAVRGAEEIEADLKSRLDLIAQGSEDPAPGPHCGYCDFLHLCQAGQDFQAAHGRP